MGKGKLGDLRKHYPDLAPDKDYPPLRFKSLKGKVSAAEVAYHEYEGVVLEMDERKRLLADRLDPSYKN